MSTKNKGLKEMYTKVIDNRFVVSIALVVVSAIIGFFLNDMSVSQWLLTTDKVLSLWWSTKFFALLLASYELFYIITNKNRNLSVAGTIVLAFSGCVQWNFTKIDSIVLAEIIVVLINNLITEKSFKKNILMSLVVIGCSIGYMYTFRPYAIAFGYLFFALLLWIFTVNRKELKNDKKKLGLITITIVLSIAMAIGSQFIYNNNYTENPENLGSGIHGLFTYTYNTMLFYKPVDNVEYFGGILSLFPLPLCIALYYLYKKEKHAAFLLPLSIMTVLEVVYCISGFPDIFEKVIMLMSVPGIRVVPAVHFANLLIMFYFIANVDDCTFKTKHAIRITLLMAVMLVFIQRPGMIAEKSNLYLIASELSLLTFMFMNYNDKRYIKVFVFFLMVFTLIGGLPVCFL